LLLQSDKSSSNFKPVFTQAPGSNDLLENRMLILARGVFGLLVLLSIAWVFSNNKRCIDWRLVLTGVTLQIAFASLILLIPGGKDVFQALGEGFVTLLSFVSAGSSFGPLVDVQKMGFVFAFQVLPTIIFLGLS
jgi:CNT family concentrative nucleoside transporter